MMGVKRKSRGSAGDSVKKRKAIALETKVDIIKRVERGEKVIAVARLHQLSRSTIATILNNKDKIMEHMKSSAPMQSTIITKKRGKVIEELEKLLSMWIVYCHQNRKPLSLMLIQEKALSLFSDLKDKYGEEEVDVTFTASRGWLHRFKARNNLHDVKVSEEAASVETVAAQEFPAVLRSRRSYERPLRTEPVSKEPRAQESAVQEGGIQNNQANIQKRPTDSEISVSDVQNTQPLIEDDPGLQTSPCQQQQQHQQHHRQQNMTTIDAVTVLDYAVDVPSTVKRELDDEIEVDEETFFECDGLDTTVFSSANNSQGSARRVSEGGLSQDTSMAEETSQDLVSDKKLEHDADSAFCEWMKLTYLRLGARQKRQARMKIMQCLTECEETSL